MIEYNKRLVEVDEILKHLSKSDYNKIPEEIKEAIEKNKDKEYKWKYDNTKKLKEQNVPDDTIAILSYINMEYLADENQKIKIQEILRRESLRFYDEKYNPDNLFKKKSNNVTVPIQYPKEGFIKKLLNKIKCFFAK